MIEISTPTSNSVCNDETDGDSMISNFSKSEDEFYESIKAPLNSLIKVPSKEVIENVLKFSKNYK
nr:hypothetical protein [Pseudopedobacter sp.]